MDLTFGWIMLDSVITREPERGVSTQLSGLSFITQVVQFPLTPTRCMPDPQTRDVTHTSCQACGYVGPPQCMASCTQCKGTIIVLHTVYYVSHCGVWFNCSVLVLWDNFFEVRQHLRRLNFGIYHEQTTTVKFEVLTPHYLTT